MELDDIQWLFVLQTTGLWPKEAKALQKKLKKKRKLIGFEDIPNRATAQHCLDWVSREK